jgi:linoleate 8R-lipoxygenase/9,12-octadecadienoate 8-hydroperoxide 8R-isomerase
LLTGQISVTCGLYVNIILSDYVKTILNMNYAPESSWVLDPRESFSQVFDKGGFPMGIGNQVSVEFNLIYRWHSAVSARDEKWSQDFFQKLVPGQDVAKLSLKDFLTVLSKWKDDVAAQKPESRTFADLKRNSSGAFNTKDLLKLIVESTQDVAGKYTLLSTHPGFFSAPTNTNPAGAFGARQVPVALKLVEILGISQARGWHVGTLNELRKFMDLTPHKTFEDINPDPEIQDAMRALYKEPDLVEIYPGVVFEDAKKPFYPGSGLCAGFTITRAILSDAITLVRGDRFYTLVCSLFSPLFPFLCPTP